MGTRADFYIGEDFEWLGSIGWDGYPSGIFEPLLNSVTEEEYRDFLKDFFAQRGDVTLPEMGWPWPWDDSHTTDYAYSFLDGKVQAWVFGRGPFDPAAVASDGDWNWSESLTRDDVFPDMSHLKNIAFNERSGIILL